MGPSHVERDLREVVCGRVTFVAVLFCVEVCMMVRVQLSGLFQPNSPNKKLYPTQTITVLALSVVFVVCPAVVLCLQQMSNNEVKVVQYESMMVVDGEG